MLIFSYLLEYTVFVSFSIWYNKFEKNALLVVIIFEINGVWCICCNFNIYTIVLLGILSDRYIITWYVVYCTPWIDVAGEPQKYNITNRVIAPTSNILWTYHYTVKYFHRIHRNVAIVIAVTTFTIGIALCFQHNKNVFT